MTETQLAKQEEGSIAPASRYAIIRKPERAISVLRANIGPSGLAVTDLDRVTVPAGGARQWLIKTLEGEKYVNEFHGVPLLFKDFRLFWEKPFSETGGGDPPDCCTVNAEADVGIGNPGGNCNVCPMDRWSDTATGRKPCSIYRALFICGPDDLIPFVLTLPVMSRQECIHYFVRLGQKGIQHFECVLRFFLVEATNRTGLKYSRVKFELVEELSEGAAKQMFAVSESLRKQLGIFSLSDAVREHEGAYVK